MAMTLLVGGARAGKSAVAARLAERSGRPVAFVATAEALDDEMAVRIARHRTDRPEAWVTIEEPIELERALARVDDDATVIVDCLTLWVTNVMLRGDDDATIAARAERAAAAAAARSGPTVVVTNEVGSGVVPASGMGRRYRDLLGWVNALWARAADDAFLVVAGRTLRLEEAP